jgi:hypothetical protein
MDGGRLVTDDKAFAVDRTIELLESCLKLVSERATFLLEVSEVCSELDWYISWPFSDMSDDDLFLSTEYSILALARATVGNQLVRPNMVSENVISIREGRHMLHERITETYVSNDTILVDDPGSIDESRIVSGVFATKISFAHMCFVQMVITGANGQPRSYRICHMPQPLILTHFTGSGKSAYAKQVYARRVSSYYPLTTSESRWL